MINNFEFLASVCGVLGFFVAIYTARRDFRDLFNLARRRSLQSKVNKIRDELQLINRLNAEPSFLVAHVCRHMFIILAMLMLAILWDISVPEKISFTDVNCISSLILSWFVGFVCGTGYRFCRYILKYDEYDRNLNEKLDMLESRLSSISNS